MPIQDYHIERDVRGILLNRENMAGKDIWILPGNCTANRHYPALPRDIDWFDENVIGSMLSIGDIGDGAGGHYPDLKLRYDRAKFGRGDDNKRLNIYLGHETFKGATEKQYRTEEETLALFKRGKEQFDGDGGAYFAKCVGVSIFVKTPGGIIVGEREVDDLQPIFNGRLQGAAGYLTYHDNVREVNLFQEYHNVLKREMGIDPDQVNSLVPLGIYSYESNSEGKFMGRDDVDLVAIAEVDIPEDEFTSGRMLQKAGRPNHKGFYVIRGMQDARSIIEGQKFNGKVWDVVFSTPIRALVAEDFQ